MSRSPQAILDAARADYDMSRESRFVRRRIGLAPQGGTADYHYRSEAKYYADIEKARDMDRNDCVVGQVIDRAVANIVQDGFTLEPRTGDKKLDLDLWQRWQDWSNDCDACDIAGEFNWQDFESKAMRSMLLDGDCVISGLDSGQLQFLEAHTIQTTTVQPNTFCGVTLDQYRKRELYWIMRDGITPTDNKETAEPLPARDAEGYRNLFHVYNPKRATQTRGVTAFAPIFALSGMFEDINFAKLVQQQVVSCFAIFRKQNGVAGDAPTTTTGYGNQVSESTESGTRLIEGIAPGMEIIGKPGEELQGFSPNVPNSEYFEHVKLMLQLIGVNLGLPLCLVLMDGSETNFSGWRGAVDEARKGFRANQQNLFKRLHRPAYSFKIRQWMAEDAALRRAAQTLNIFEHAWRMPTWSYIDPVGDAQGDALRLTNGLISPRRLHAERMRDWEEVAEESVQDNAYAIRLAKKEAMSINTDFADGQPVHWRELISLPMPAGLQMTMSDPNANKPEEAPATGTGEMSTLNRRQFQNNQKAITDLLNALIDGSMSEARVRVGLSALGLSPANVDALIEDARDGKVDTV